MKKKENLNDKVTDFFNEHKINLSQINCPKLNVIKDIYKLSISNTNNKMQRKFNNLLNIISNKQILMIAYNNIKSNSGAGTISTDDVTADKVSIRRIEKIAEKLKNNTHKWSKIRQIYVPKPNKGIKNWTKKKLIEYGRPIGIPNFDDKIVQEAIRIVLMSIYEPIFEENGNSYAFRLGYSTLNLMHEIKEKTQGMEIAIEGDINKAFNSMNHNILRNILKKNIIDNKFIELIISCCKTGIMDELKRIVELPIEGTPQGAILSPIIWNIYMNEFDQYIKTDIQNLINILNTKQIIKHANPSDKRSKTVYRYDTTKPTSSNQHKVLTSKLGKLRTDIVNITHRTKFYRLPIKKRNLVKPLILEKNKLEKKLFSIPSNNRARIKLRIYYKRYADDFILLSNANPTIMKYIKNKLSSYLKYNLELKLNNEKTIITNLKLKPVKFLGYSLFKIRNPRIKYVEPHIKKRTTGEAISIGIDYSRIISRFITRGYINKKRIITSVGELTKKTETEIIIRFNEIIMGYAIYYLPIISQEEYFIYILYILNYSCYKTLCHKNRTTINKLLKVHKEGLSVTKINLDNPQKSQTYTLITHKNVKEKLSPTINKIIDNLYKGVKQEAKMETLFLEYRKGFWRTNVSMISGCINCGTFQDIEYHHIKKLSDTKSKYKYTYDYNIRALNRKNIPVCALCHLKIHKGELNNKTISDLYDKRLAQYETYIKIKNDL